MEKRKKKTMNVGRRLMMTMMVGRRRREKRKMKGNLLRGSTN